MGYKYQVVAVASVNCRELITSAGGKVHGRAILTGVETMKGCVSAGSLEYWMRLKLPITQAAKLYQVCEGYVLVVVGYLLNQHVHIILDDLGSFQGSCYCGLYESPAHGHSHLPPTP